MILDWSHEDGQKATRRFELMAPLAVEVGDKIVSSVKFQRFLATQMNGIGVSFRPFAVSISAGKRFADFVCQSALQQRMLLQILEPLQHKAS